MNILITGATGLIGSHIKEYLLQQNIGEILAPTSQELDITSHDSIDSYFVANNPEIIIHCAAYTDVNGGELQRNDTNGSAWIINVEGTEHIAQAAQTNKAEFIHISTDMVFCGRKDDPGPYPENHPIETDSAKVSWYGWTKAEAERVIGKYFPQSAIVRISNPARAKFENKLDYVRKIISAYDQRKPIKLFNDQHLTLTYVDEVSEAIYEIIQKKSHGIFHVSSSNVFTPYELAVYLLDKVRGATDVVQASSIEQFLAQPGNNARYLQFGGLDVQTTEETLEMQFRTWQEIIDSLIDQGI